MRDSGMTLVELCIALALVAMLAGLAIPSFQASLRAATIRTAAFDLMTGLQQTRGSSILEGRVGVFCLTDAAGRCLAGTGDGVGWRAFLETPAGPMPLAERSLPARVRLRATRPTLRFWPRALAASTGTLTICPSSAHGGAAAPRALVVSQGGRARFAAPPPGACS